MQTIKGCLVAAGSRSGSDHDWRGVGGFQEEKASNSILKEE